MQGLRTRSGARSARIRAAPPQTLARSTRDAGIHCRRDQCACGCACATVRGAARACVLRRQQHSRLGVRPVCLCASKTHVWLSREVVGGGRQRSHARTRATALVHVFRWVNSITLSRLGLIQVHEGQARSSSNHTFICVDHRNSVHTYARTA